MALRRVGPPHLVTAFGGLLFLVAVVHHANELAAVDDAVGPVAALLLDGLPALGLAYAGFWLAGTDLSPEGRRQVWRWCLLGATLFVVAIGLSLLVRAFEGRVVGESLFPLLIAAEAGGIAGFIAGFHNARTRMETRRARTVSDALEFVNSLIRHDLRNDLNVIRGHAGLLEADGDSGEAERQSDTPSIIGEKAEEALTRIETTGAVTETLTGDPDLERVDLADVAGEMARRIESTYDVTVTTELPDTALVDANAGLRSAVDNLLENAVEHNDADEPRVDVVLEIDAETVRLAIGDNGPGISDEQKEGVFDARSETSGRGGLTLVHTLVDSYDGEIRVEDNDPRGVVFLVELPRADTGP